MGQVRTKAFVAKQLIDPATNERLEVRAVKLTEKNMVDVRNWLTRNGAPAEYSEFITENGDILNHKLKVYQLNASELKSGKLVVKRGWRVARPGDYVVRYPDGTYARVKSETFTEAYEAK